MLEVVRHVNIGNDLVRPTTECLSGSRLITSYFKSNPDHEPLGRGALRLMQSPGEGRSYSVVGSEWVRCSLPPGRPEPANDTPAAAPDAEAQLASLRQRVKALGLLQESLLLRLARLELRALERSEEEAEAEAAEAAEQAAGPAGQSADPASADGSSAPGAERIELPPEASSAEPVPAARPSQAAAAPMALDARARPLVALELPPIAELSRCIALLVGDGLTVEEAEPLDTSALAHAFAAGIETDSGEQVGLILMDLRSTVFLGGTLMMQPVEQLDQQYASAAPEPDSIAASAEICNALSAAVNAAQSRYHVRATPLGPLEPARYDWLPAVVTRRDLRDSFGGRTSVLARPGA